MNTESLMNMKKHISLYMAAVLAVGGLALSCSKDTSNPYKDEKDPEVSLTTPSSAFVQDKAELVLTLSHYVHKDVVVTFAVDGIERAAIDLPETFTIEAGAVTKTLPVQVDEDETTIGNKTIAITMAEADGAKIVNDRVSLGIKVEDIAFVNVSTTGLNAGKATLTFTLSKKLTKDAVLGLRLASAVPSDKIALPAANVSFASSVTIPAGARTASIDVEADTAGLPEGAYEADIEIGSFSDNVVAGSTIKAALSINIGFKPTLQSNQIMYFQYYNYYWYVNYDKVETHDSFFLWPEPATAGSLSDAEYVKAALYRCRDFIQKESNRKAVQDYWDSMRASGYTSVPTSTPIARSAAGAYLGWPELFVDGTGVVDMTKGTTYHVFMVGFDANLNVSESYFVISYTE